MSPRSLLRDESISHEGLTWAEVDNLDDTELDDEIEAFERSLRADWEVRPNPSRGLSACKQSFSMICRINTKASALPWPFKQIFIFITRI